MYLDSAFLAFSGVLAECKISKLRGLRLWSESESHPLRHFSLYGPKRSFTERSEDIVYTLGPKSLFKGCRVFFLQIDVSKIVVHKSHQPDAIVDLLDTDGLTRQRSAEIYFLFKNADPSAVGNQSGAIVEGIKSPDLGYVTAFDHENPVVKEHEYRQ